MPLPGLRLLPGRLRARHLRQHEDGGGDGLHRQGPALQSALPAGVRALSRRSLRQHAGIRLGEGPGREPSQARPRALLHAAAANLVSWRANSTISIDQVWHPIFLVECIRISIVSQGKSNFRSARPMKLIHLIGAARPNFMKVAPLYHAFQNEADWANAMIIHTGQHYDYGMSAAFFADLGLPAPDVNLEVGSGTHAEQTGGVMIAYERLCRDHRPDWVIVVGDVNSTMACTLAAKKLELPVAHLEAGLRSRDRTMPEEINRVG